MKIVTRAKPRQKSIALGSRIVAAAPRFRLFRSAAGGCRPLIRGRAGSAKADEGGGHAAGRTRWSRSRYAPARSPSHDDPPDHDPRSLDPRYGPDVGRQP